MTDTKKTDATAEATAATDVSEQKRKELLEKYGYKRSAESAEPAETGACGKTRRRTCC